MMDYVTTWLELGYIAICGMCSRHKADNAHGYFNDRRTLCRIKFTVGLVALLGLSKYPKRNLQYYLLIFPIHRCLKVKTE